MAFNAFDVRKTANAAQAPKTSKKRPPKKQVFPAPKSSSPGMIPKTPSAKPAASPEGVASFIGALSTRKRRGGGLY